MDKTGIIRAPTRPTSRLVGETAQLVLEVKGKTIVSSAGPAPFDASFTDNTGTYGFSSD